MSPIIEFYSDSGNPYSIVDIVQNWSDDKLDACHNFIQWLFPLKEPSNFNSDAPLLTDEDIKEFNELLMPQLMIKMAFRRFINFLGLDYKFDENGYEIVPADNFKDREFLWIAFNHNHLRITRCIQSCILLGLDRNAKALFDCLTVLKDKYNISENTYKYWADAAFLNVKNLTKEEIQESREAVESGKTPFVPQEVD